MARATESEQTGSTAVNEALGKFARIGFGHAEITRHDNGTDVFLLVRDTRRFDLGLTLGAQIKGGRSWFDEELRDDDGSLIGWWFRDNDGKHIDDWLAHGLPHLIMQHDLDADTSYWAHVTAEAVVPTGKGKKILIPASQRVDENSLDALIAIGATPRAAPPWEGSAWRGARSVLDKDRLRYALLVPRLVAPHPNQGVSSPVTPHQAIAMLMRARLAELHEWTERGLAPTTAAAEASDDWYWRFFAALRRRLTTGETDPIVAAHPGAPSDSAHAAAAVAASACLMEDDRANDAIPILQATLAADRAEPVDHAWLAVQLARAYVEVGRVDEAKVLAASIQGMARSHADDVTATAIAGAGIRLLFSVTAIDDGDLAGTIEASDTAASWWRHEAAGWALGDVLDRTFDGCVRDGALSYTARDEAHDELLLVSLSATFLGLHAEWRAFVGLLGRDTFIRLDRHDDPATARKGLSALLRSGTNRCWRGPRAG